MPDQNAYFVQFPHPGEEHTPPKAPTTEMAWNTGEHGRKFLIAPGRYQDGAGSIRKAKLAFWGEWEPPSCVEQQWPADGRLPRALHRPYWGKLKNGAPRQNTDPWVFGHTMLYSNCKQLGPRPLRNPSAMQDLTRGSVICFGSTIAGEFCADTVFVVASVERWTPADAPKLNVDEAFRVCVADSLKAKGNNFSLKLYRGATFKNPVEGMFSFVPARMANEKDPRFARPPIHHEFVNPLNQAPWGSKRPLSIGRVREAWDDVRRQVHCAGLLLAVRLQTPPCVAAAIVVPQGSGKGC